jgi:lipopolysaccharide exporter
MSADKGIMADQSEENLEAHDQIARGAIWMISMRWTLRVLGLINVIILARLLVPEDFGLVAMAMILIGLITTITDGSFDQAILKDKDTSTDMYHSAWTVQVMAGILATFLIYLVSPFVVSYFNDERLALIIYIAGLKPAIHGFENIGQLEFRRDFNFQKEFRYWVYRQLLTILISITLAVILRNYLALAIVAPLSSLVMVVLSFRMSSFRPHFSTTYISQLISFSKWYAILDSARFAADKIDELIVGRIGSATILGHYYVASDLATMPTRELVMPLDRALVPTLAHLRHDQVELRKALQNTLSVVVSLCLSMGVGLYLIASDFILVVLGSQWAPAIPFFEWLAFYGLFSGLVISVQSFFIAIDRFSLYGLSYLAYLVLLIVALVTTASTIGVDGIAPVRTFCMVGFFCLIYGFLMRHKLLSLSNLMACSWRPVIAVFGMWFCVRVAQAFIEESTVGGLLVQIVLGVCSFLVIQALSWWLAGRPEGVESKVQSAIKKALPTLMR